MLGHASDHDRRSVSNRNEGQSDVVDGRLRRVHLVPPISDLAAMKVGRETPVTSASRCSATPVTTTAVPYLIETKGSLRLSMAACEESIWFHQFQISRQ